MTDAKTHYRNWYNRNKEAYRPRKAALMRKYRAENPEKHRAQGRATKARLRERLLAMYGCTCAICGFTDARALTLDHIQKNGAAERLSLGEYGVYRRALKEHRPNEYRTLCMNCQFITRQEWLQQHGNF